MEDDAETEHILSSRYQILLGQTEEITGAPIAKELAQVCEQTWGQCVLSREGKKEMLKDIRVPSNCKLMRAPKLNTELYIRMYKASLTYDKAKIILSIN